MLFSSRLTAAALIALAVATAGPSSSTESDLSRRSSEGAESDWPRWRGAAFDGTATTARPLFADPFELRIRWKKKLGPGYSGVVVAGSHAVTMFSDGGNDVVVSMSPDTGREQWRVPLAPSFPARDGSTGGPVSTPAIHRGTVFALGPHGDLVALRASDGRQLWKRHLVKELGASVPHWGFTTSPLVSGNAVIVLTGGAHAVTAFDTRTGSTVWQSGSDIASYQSPMLIRIGSRELLVVGGDQFLFGLDPRDGRELWKYEHGGAGFYAKIINPVVVGTNGLLLTYRPDQSVLLRLETPDAPPTVAWTSRELKLNYGTPVVRGDLVFGYSGGFLTAIDAKTGALKWRSRPPGDGFPILVDGHLVIAAKQGQLIVAGATADGYQPKASIDLFSNLLWTPPSFAGGRIFARDSYEEIAAVDVIPSKRMTEFTPAEGRLKSASTGRIPGSQFAQWVESVEKSPDSAARVKAFLEKQQSFPVIEGERYAHILYTGDAKEVQLRSDVLGTGSEIPMHRVAGTDLRYASLELEPDARVAYQFSAALGETAADPRNPVKGTSENFTGDVSLLFMPRADRRIPSPAQGTFGGKTVDLTFDSGTARAEHLTWGGKREVHVYLPRGYEAESSRRWPALYVLYGNQMLNDGHLAATLDREMGASIQPAIVVFVQSTNAYEYARTFRSAHIQMLSERLVPWIDGQFRTRTDARNRLLTGADEAGFAAVEIGLRSPAVFGSILAQSLFPLSSGDRELLDLIDRTPVSSQVFYVDWGRYDPRRASDKLDVRGFSAQVRERLAKRGYVVRGREWNDGSTVALWAARLVTALKQILPMTPSQQDAGSHARSQAYNRALGVSCEHCHTADRWADDGKPQFRTAKGMARMVVALNEGALKGVGEVACWTCHRGDVRPSRVPRDVMDAELAKWPAALASAPEAVKLAMSVYNVTLGVSCDHCHTADWKQYREGADEAGGKNELDVRRVPEVHACDGAHTVLHVPQGIDQA